ncbi:MAG: hypothetical protein KKC85_13255 [Gammaproteobacteria bacterium]|nr:hypothetical protein [Gammaproteobacteria bacterium]MBU1443894.1 hypothetical protein [Gammaproteobacteria bacterium]MBU2287393.1 hypothetical protein [Gammaproteobacteria bacterium]
MKPLHSNAAIPGRIRRWLAVVAVLVGMALLVGFGWRAWKQIQFNQRVARGEVQVETLRGWMTLPYIERVYGVPQVELRQALGLPATGFDDRSVHDWGKEANLDPVAARRTIEKLILERAPPTGAAK